MEEEGLSLSLGVRGLNWLEGADRLQRGDGSILGGADAFTLEGDDILELPEE